MSMGLTMPTAYPGPRPAMRGYGRAVDAATLVGLLADPARLKVVAALALGAGSLEEVAAASGLPLKEVALAARRLARARSGAPRRAGAPRRPRPDAAHRALRCGRARRGRGGATARAAVGRPGRGRR